MKLFVIGSGCGGHPAGVHHKPGNPWKIPGNSTISPADAAAYMGLHNVMMVRYGDEPAPPFEPYARPFCGLKRLVWSVVGDASTTSNNAASDADTVLPLAARMPNMTGVIMDDFFRRDAANPARLSLSQLADLHGRLRSAPRPLDLYAVLYKHEMDLPIQPFLEHIDAITYWTWRANELPGLESDFARFEAFVPRHRKLLGLYMWDYGESRPMPAETMRDQCELGLQWLRSGRVEGLVFLASCIVDVGLQTVEYSRQLIAEVGEEEIG